MQSLPEVLASAKGGGGTAWGAGAGRLRRPSQNGLSSNARAPSVNFATPWRRSGNLNSRRAQVREEQPCSAVLGCLLQVEHPLPKADSSNPESLPASLPAYPGRADSCRSEASEHKVIANQSELFAASVGNVDWLRFCLRRKHKELTVDDKGFTAIHFAAQQNRLSCLQVLVEEYKIPVDLPTSNGQTPLHLLVTQKNDRADTIPCMDYLLKKGAHINSRTCQGSTPLHLAARNGLLGCMKVLVRNGANVHARDAVGHKPIDYCKLWNHRACARFLKDAMWKQDKKDFAREMDKLKTLKGKLAILEFRYLTEFQKEQRILREAHFRTWLQGKLLAKTQGSARPKQEAGVRSWSLAFSKTLGPQIAKSFQNYPSVEAQLQSLPSPVVPPKLIYKHRPINRPKLWNFSNNPERPPITKIGYPQGIRLGVHPDPSKEHDFCRFLEVTQNPLGGTCLRTVDNQLVTPVPWLPLEVISRMLHPGVQPCRMKVPQGLFPLDILRVSQKRHVGDTCTNTMAMNLRETFDEPFLATLKAYQTPAALPSKEVLT
ncbi:ankyrin repeat domain-containing protein 53 [Acomys russatus]|uniref:ankyrin repeat domain-containing protein 53 n=1 Tax=Acomys russatus TaxID=60746 RepID=UPI0021E212BA|nr:ankyrin repeat domain-containing protein 53 [Acomys russatus]